MYVYVCVYTHVHERTCTLTHQRYCTYTYKHTHKHIHKHIHKHTPQVLLTDFHGEHEQFVVTNGTILSARGASGLFPLLQNLQDNVARSAQGDVAKGFVAQGDVNRDVDVSRDVDVRTASLDWATPQSSLGTFDFIAGSDCVYSLEAVEPLAATIFRSAVSFSFCHIFRSFFFSPSRLFFQFPEPLVAMIFRSVLSFLFSFFVSSFFMRPESPWSPPFQGI